MERVQLAIRDARYAKALQELLERNGDVEVCRVEAPDPARGGVIVVDAEGLERLPSAALDPDRVVLITRNDPHNLARAWNAGIRSVVFSEDPLNMAVLAIMAVELRSGKPEGPATPAGSPGVTGTEPKKVRKHDAPAG
jgi:DNA-binding NarL/FixJ family response regulator